VGVRLYSDVALRNIFTYGKFKFKIEIQESYYIDYCLPNAVHLCKVRPPKTSY